MGAEEAAGAGVGGVGLAVSVLVEAATWAPEAALGVRAGMVLAAAAPCTKVTTGGGGRRDGSAGAVRDQQHARGTGAVSKQLA